MKIEVVECAINQPSIVLEDLQFGEVQKVDTTLLPMIHKDQDEIVLIPQIDFVILEEFDVVECKVFHLFMLPKMILDLTQELLARLLIL